MDWDEDEDRPLLQQQQQHSHRSDTQETEGSPTSLRRRRHVPLNLPLKPKGRAHFTLPSLAHTTGHSFQRSTDPLLPRKRRRLHSTAEEPLQSIGFGAEDGGIDPATAAEGRKDEGGTILLKPSSSSSSSSSSSDSSFFLAPLWTALLNFWLWKDVRRYPSYYFACLIVAASQGFSESFAALAVSYYYKDDLGISPSNVQAASSLMVLAWMVKPLFGFISDSFPLFGYRRKSYLCIMGLLGSVCWFTMATLVDSFPASVAVLFLFQLSMAFINTLAKALIVEQANHHSQRLQERRNRRALREESQAEMDAEEEEEEEVETLLDARVYTSFQISFFAGTLHTISIISQYIGGALLEFGVSKRTVMGCSGILPLLCAAAGLLLTEDPWPNHLRVSVMSQVRRLWEVVQSRPAEATPENLTRIPIYYPALFILIWMATPTSGAAMFYFFSNDLEFGPEVIARIQLIGNVCGLAGILLYQNFFAEVRFRRLLLCTSLVGVAASMVPIMVVTHYNRKLGIPDIAFCIADTALISAVGEIALMPLLTLAATVCEVQGVEGSLYALLMSVANIGSSLSELLGAIVMRLLGIGATEFTYLWLLLLICSLSSLLPLPLLWILVPQQAKSEQEFWEAREEGQFRGTTDEEVLLEEDADDHFDDNGDYHDDDDDDDGDDDDLNRRSGSTALRESDADSHFPLTEESATLDRIQANLLGPPGTRVMVWTDEDEDEEEKPHGPGSLP